MPKERRIDRRQLPLPMEGPQETPPTPKPISSNSEVKKLTERLQHALNNNATIRSNNQVLKAATRSLRSEVEKHSKESVKLYTEKEELKEQLKEEKSRHALTEKALERSLRELESATVSAQRLRSDLQTFEFRTNFAQNPWELLGVSPDSFSGLTPSEVRKKVDKIQATLSRIYHPDGGIAPNEKRIREVNDACDIIRTMFL